MVSTPPPGDAPLEFTFGPLSTVEGRAQRSRSQGVGLQHHNRIEPPDPLPGQPVTITIQAGAGVAIRSATLLYTLDGSHPRRSSPATIETPFLRTALNWDTLSWSYLETWKAEIPGQGEGTLVQYQVVAETIDGREIPCPFINDDNLQAGGRLESLDLRYLHRLQRDPEPPIYAYRVDSLEIPDWLREAVIYQVFVDRFAADPGAPLRNDEDLTRFAGGTIRGIIHRLGYLHDLGINCLWLTPIFPSPSYHGYDPLDLASVEPRLGSLDDFKELIRAAHSEGMRVLIDFVANHVSNLHPAFQAAQRQAPSPHRGWFFFKDHPDQYESFYDVPGQPILNTDLPAVRQYLIEAAEYWLRSDCDGFRLDHAHGASHAFWSEFRARTRAVNEDAVMIGEITEEPSTLQTFTGRMDGALDFALLELFRNFFAYRSIPASEFERGLRNHLDYFKGGLILPSFLDNHDMNRFLWVTGGDTRQLTLAALCQFTLPHPPVVYYGTEVGLSQRRAVGALEESRLIMPWEAEQDSELHRFYTDLIHLRRRSSQEWGSMDKPLIIDDENGVIAYRSGPYLTILNNSPHPIRLDLPIQKLLLANLPEVKLTPRGIDLPGFGGAICEGSAEDDHPGGG